MEISFEAHRLTMGGRVMFLAAADAPSVVQLTSQPIEWNPLAKTPHGNRPRYKQHWEAIKQYLISEPDPILNAVVLYADPDEVRWEPVEGFDDVGRVRIKVGARFDVGDGQHRLKGLAAALAEYEEADDDDPVARKLRQMSVSMLINPDKNPLRRAQDFTDLQRNSKPPSGSLGSSMDRRKAINRFTLEVVKQAKLFDGGQRIEFLKDTVGKLSGRMYTFQAFRQFLMTVLIGTAQRTRLGIEKAADEALEGKYEAELKKMVGFLDDAADVMPGWRDVVSQRLVDGKPYSVAQFREEYLLSTAAGLYAFGIAVHEIANAGTPSMDEGLHAIASVDWRRPTGASFWDDSLVLKTTQPDGTIKRKLASGRPAWEEAGARLYAHVVSGSQRTAA